MKLSAREDPPETSSGAQEADRLLASREGELFHATTERKYVLLCLDGGGSLSPHLEDGLRRRACRST